ncbi:MAG: extracellular solute-binding protein [Lachnospiraceae bacterium]|nr:extracellular solute-binding protein [Lachnospiraceae bacterium]
MMRLYRKKMYNTFCLLLAAMVLLAGCGVKNQETSQGTNQETEQEQNIQEPPRDAVDWSELQLTAAQEASDGTQWRLREFYDDWITYPETYDMKFPFFYNGPRGEILACTQYVSYGEDGAIYDIWHCLDYFDTGTGETFHTRIDSAVYEEWGLLSTANLVQADVIGDKLIACYFCSSEDIGTPRSLCSLVLYHMEDGLQKSLDLLPALTEAGMANRIAFFSEENVVCDRDGCCYIVLSNKLLVINEKGELLLAADSNMSGNASLSYLCKTPEGLPLFVCSDLSSRSNSYWIYDHDAGELRSLGQSGYRSQPYGCANIYGDLFYFIENNVVRWDTLTGTLEKIFDCRADSIFSNLSAAKHMTIREDGDLVILDPVTENKCIYVLSPTAAEPERVLTLVGTAYGTPQLEQTAAALFSMKKPGVSIAVSEMDVDNLMNQIVAGDAPDMMIVSAETMQILYEKGMLADLSDAIPAELREQVFDCVWQAGTIDGKLTGLTTSIGAHTMLVSRDVWAQDTWSLEDILTLAENAPEDTLKGLIPRVGYDPSSSSLLYWLALQDIDSSIVDRENNVCHFDCENFRKLLEYCKNTPYPETEYSYNDSSYAEAVMEGEYLASPCTRGMGDLHSFSSQMAIFSEDYHCVGVPTERESGNLVYAAYFLVVNKNSENMDLILEFLPTLYGDEIARKYPQNCLRRDVLRSRVIIPDWDSRPQFSMGEGIYEILPSKPDGTSYVEEYIAFMDSCILSPIKDARVASIVLEEVEPYFAGDKDMDTVIGIIQSRVQMYLNENGS